MNQFSQTDDLKTLRLPSGFIKLRDDAKFLESESALVIISPNGHLWLKASWIKNLHSKLQPLLRKGCFEEKLIRSIDEEKRRVVKAYLNALNQSGVLLGKYSKQKESLDENRLLSGSTKNQQFYSKKNLSADFHFNENLIVRQNGSEQILVAFDSANLLRVCNALLVAGNFRQNCLVLNDSPMSETGLFTKVSEWLLSDLPKNYPGYQEIKFYHWDEKHLNCRLKFKKHPARLFSFRDIVQKTGLVTPQKTTPQLPLAVLERNVSRESVKELTISINYQPAADNIVIREMVRQTAFSGQDGAPVSKSFHSSKDFLASASKLELQAELIDQTVSRIFAAADDASVTEIEIFSKFENVPAINYLQTVLRKQFSSLVIRRQRLFDHFYIYQAGSNKTVSLCEEKAFFDLLLLLTYSEYYRTLAEAIQPVYFYSGYSSFVARRKLRLLVKQARKYLFKTHGENFPEIEKIETFWGSFYWVGIKARNKENFNQIYNQQKLEKKFNNKLQVGEEGELFK